MTYKMVIDLKRCVGCHACSASCKEANGTRPGVTRSWVEKTLEGSYPETKRVIIPMLCMHCDNAVCIEACQTGATYKTEEGIVVVDKAECLGCQSCAEACPYGARYYSDNGDGYFGEALNEYEAIAYENMPEGTIDKCDFCFSKTPKGEVPAPACVQACVAGARFFGAAEAMDSFISSEGRDSFRLYEDEGTSPNVVYFSDFINQI